MCPMIIGVSAAQIFSHQFSHTNTSFISLLNNNNDNIYYCCMLLMMKCLSDLTANVHTLTAGCHSLQHCNGEGALGSIWVSGGCLRFSVARKIVLSIQTFQITLSFMIIFKMKATNFNFKMWVNKSSFVAFYSKDLQIGGSSTFSVAGLNIPPTIIQVFKILEKCLNITMASFKFSQKKMLKLTNPTRIIIFSQTLNQLFHPIYLHICF